MLLGFAAYFEIISTISIILHRLTLDCFTQLNPKWAAGVRCRPGEVKLDLTFWPIVADRWGLNWKNPVHEESCVYDVWLCYLGPPGLGTCTDRCRAKCLLRKSKRSGLTENLPPPTLYANRDGNRWESWLAPCRTADHSLAGLLTPLGGL
jgi:hypothetical protein